MAKLKFCFHLGIVARSSNCCQLTHGSFFEGALTIYHSHQGSGTPANDDAAAVVVVVVVGAVVVVAVVVDEADAVAAVVVVAVAVDGDETVVQQCGVPSCAGQEVAGRPGAEGLVSWHLEY